jgi:hypothetical protein
MTYAAKYGRRSRGSPGRGPLMRSWRAECPARSLIASGYGLATWNASCDPSRHLSPYTSICSSRSWLD